MKRAAIVLVLAWASVSPAASQGYIFALQRHSCGAWLEERKIGAYSLQAWALGYLSGASVYGGVNMQGLHPDDVLDWIDNYCRMHASNLITEPLAAFIKERSW
jgi:hypothetical protein